MRRIWIPALLFAALFFFACTPAAGSVPPPTQQPIDSTPTAVISTATPASTPTPTLSPTPTPPQPVGLSVVMVGDVMLGRMVNVTNIEKDDFTWPFQETADVLRGADLALGNLESPVIEECPINEVTTLFCADSRSVEGLAWAGFDGMSLANNHSGDRGEEGLEQTITYLEEAGIDPFFGERVMIREIRGVRVGVMGLDDVDAALNVEETLAAVEALAGQVDVLIGMMHWGYEYRPNYSLRQQYVGHALIDAGMDVVFGAHPHWVQPYEEYNDRLIFYSLGNFVFDQMWSDQTRAGQLVRLKLVVHPNPGELEIGYEVIPVTIYDFGQPQFDESLARGWEE
jgi:poly-gamma-glutamate capsule biosynthesis protein CapA/YwtB (metallophosphatase superfamily)